MAIPNTKDIISSAQASSDTLATGGVDTSRLNTALSSLSGTLNAKSLAPQPSFDLSTSPVDAPQVDDVQRDLGVDSQFRKDNKDALAQKVETDRANTAAATETSFDDYIDNILSAPTFSQIEAKQYEKLGVDEKQLVVDKYDTQLLSEQDALRTKLERIQQNGGGLKMGAQSEMANAERVSLSKQADLALLRMAAQDELEYSTRVADRAVNAMFERQERINTVFKETYERNKNLFDKAEQREFDLLLSDRDRKLEQEKEDERLLKATKIEALKMLGLNNAPEGLKAAVMAAETPEDVISTAGQYGTVDLLQRSQLRASIANSWSSYDLNKIKLDAEKNKQKQIEEAINNGGFVLDDSQKDIAFKISKEYENESGEFKKQVGAYNRIIASAQEPSAAGDLALIFNYMKLLDPGSTVREGEFATAQNSASVPDIIRAKYNQVASGQRLAENTRDDFVERSSFLYSSALDQQIELEDRYRQQAVDVFGLPEPAADSVIQSIRAVGAVSDVAFGLQIDNLSVEQMASLMEEGLLK